MTLVDAHRAELYASGLSDETIAHAGLFSAPERQVRDLLGYGAGPGLVFPYPSLNGSAPYARVKLDKAGADGKRYRSPARQPNRLYVPPLLDPKLLADTSTPLWLTEGEKKCLKAAQEGLPCLAISGVWSWRTRPERDKSVPIPDLEHVVWRGRTVYIVFDSDLATKPDVRRAEFALSQELGRRGARVLAVRLPGGPNGEKVGLDDYLMAHSVEALCLIEPVEIPDPVGVATIELIDAADLVARDFPAEPALVGGGLIVPRALVVNGGPAKRGKSLLVINREICRSLGRPFLGFPTTPGRTLYIQAEIPEPQLKQRLVLMLTDCPDYGPVDAEKLRGRLLTVTRRGLFIDEPAGYDAVRRLIEQAEPDLVSLDPLARFMTGEENSARDVGQLINSLDRLIQEYRIAIELTHHAGKPAANDPRQGGQRLRGSSALFGAADAVMMLDRTQDAWLLSLELRHAEEPPPMLLDRTPSLWFTPSGPPEKLLAVGNIVKDLPLRFSALVGAIREDTSASERTAERLIRDAKKAGVVWQGDDGLYRRTVKQPSLTRDGSGSGE